MACVERIKYLEEENKNLKKELELVRKNTRANVETLDLMYWENVDLKKENKEIAIENKKLKENIAWYEKEEDRLREENKKLKEKLSEVTMVADDEKQSIEHILELEEENKKLKERIDELEKCNLNLQERLDRKEEVNKKMREELSKKNMETWFDEKAENIFIDKNWKVVSGWEFRELC